VRLLNNFAKNPILGDILGFAAELCAIGGDDGAEAGEDVSDCWSLLFSESPLTWSSLSSCSGGEGDGALPTRGPYLEPAG
jgi:hypothetical protein